MTTVTENSFALLDEQQYMSLTTFRKNGEAKATAVWFAQADNKLYVYTGVESWKVKRIKNNPLVEIAPCKSSGELIGNEKASGQARILSADEDAIARQALKKKYGLMKSVFAFMGKLRGQKSLYLEISASE